MPKDVIFRDDGNGGKPFVFNADVATVFPDMLRRSVPGYQRTLTVAGRLAQRCVTPDSRIYDLGCSLGACALAVSQAVTHKNVEIIGVDNSAAMLEKAATVLGDSKRHTITLLEQDILETQIDNASLVILNFTLQFVAPPKRNELLKRIHAGLNPGGALLLSEKIRFDESVTSSAIIDLHEDFKRDQGYSELEIARKREALENVLIPDSAEELAERLRSSGFSDSGQWQQRYNFCSYLAFKK